MTNENITITTDDIEQPAMMSAFGDGGMDVSPEEINPDAIIEAAEIVRDNEEPNSNTHVLVGGVLVAMAKEQKRVSQTTDTILNSETERQKSFEESQQERDEEFKETMKEYEGLPATVEANKAEANMKIEDITPYIENIDGKKYLVFGRLISLHAAE